MDRRLKVIRSVWVTFLFVIVAFFAWSLVCPSGSVRYAQNFQQQNYQRIGKLKPIERTLPPTQTGQTVLGGPIYFAVNQPRQFQKAKVKISYRTNKNFNHPQIELGLLSNKSLWQYQLKPLENSLIEQAEKSWSGLREGDELLLQRQSVYRSIGDFKTNPPAFEQIATYNHEWQLEKNFNTLATGTSVIDWSLLGSYQLYTLVSDKLDVEFNFKKNPVKLDEAPMTELQLYQGRHLVAVRKLEAERIKGDAAGQWSYNFKADKLKSGYYKVILRADNNLVTDRITIKQGDASFVGRLQFAVGQTLPLNLWTNSREVSFLARTSESVGEIFLNNERQLVSEAFRQFSYKTKSRNTSIKLTTVGLELSGDGVFAQREVSLFDPRLKQIDSLTDLNQEKIDFILTRYTDTKQTNDWHEAEVEFDLNGADFEQGSYNFVLSVPGFKSDDDKLDWLEIGRIEVELSGDNLWQTMKTTIKKALHKLFL